MRYWARSRRLGAYTALTAGLTALAMWSGDATIPLPNLRVGPWNHVTLAYLLATVPGFGWLAIARTARTPMEQSSTVSARLRLLDQLAPLIPPALASLGAGIIGGRVNAGISRNLLFTAGAALALLYVVGWLVAAVILLAHLVACGVAGFSAGQFEPDSWAFVIADAQPPWSGLAPATAIAFSWLLVPIPAAGKSAIRWWRRRARRSSAARPGPSWPLRRRRQSGRHAVRGARHGDDDRSCAPP